MVKKKLNTKQHKPKQRKQKQNDQTEKKKFPSAEVEIRSIGA